MQMVNIFKKYEIPIYFLNLDMLYDIKSNVYNYLNLNLMNENLIFMRDLERVLKTNANGE
jgi:hypothetical protein